MKTLVLIVVFAIAFVGVVGFSQSIIDYLKKWKNQQ